MNIVIVIFGHFLSIKDVTLGISVQTYKPKDMKLVNALNELTAGELAEGDAEFRSILWQYHWSVCPNTCWHLS